MSLCSEILYKARFEHGFATRGSDVSQSSGISMVEQVHGARVLWVGDEERWEGERADALATKTHTVGVRTADCVPLLLADPRTGAVAAVHAGWKGTIASIASEAVHALVSGGSRVEDLFAAIGPSIGRCCYEVSEELADRFEAAFGPEVREGRRIDLRLANRLQLERAGVPGSSVEQVGGCTFCDATLYFSYRRDGEKAGRQISFIRGRPLP